MVGVEFTKDSAEWSTIGVDRVLKVSNTVVVAFVQEEAKHTGPFRGRFGASQPNADCEMGRLKHAVHGV